MMFNALNELESRLGTRYLLAQFCLGLAGGITQTENFCAVFSEY